MAEAHALAQALNLLRTPSLASRYRSAPLPPGVALVIRVAGEDTEAETEALARCGGRPIEAIRDAARFYIAQILFDPRSDAYRTLGLDSYATREELRSNMALLLKWLHPDKDVAGENAVFVGRIIKAWDRLKTEDRRTDYDMKLLEAQQHTRQGIPRRTARRRNQSRSRLLSRMAVEKMAGQQPSWRRKLLKSAAACATIVLGMAVVGEYATGIRLSDRLQPYVQAMRDQVTNLITGVDAKSDCCVRANEVAAPEQEVQASHEQDR